MGSSRSKARAHVVAWLLAGAAGPAFAEIVYSGPIAITVPATIDGIYLNIVTGARGSTGATPGWDVNPFGTGASFKLFGPSALTTYYSLENTAAGTFRLPQGTVISGSTFFNPTSLELSPQLNLESSDNLFGFRFSNEDGGTVHMGWMRLQFGATSAVRTIVEYAYESVPGTAIAAGDTGIEPADLSIDKTVDLDGLDGGEVEYMIVVANAGPADVIAATVADTFVAPQTSVTWSCVAAGGATCPAGGTGDIAATVNLPAASSVVFTAFAQAPVPLIGRFDNTATVTAPAGIADPVSANNTDTVVVQRLALFADGFEQLPN